MIGAKNTPIVLQDGTTKTFVIHKFDCISGREIVHKYPVANLPKLGDYKTSEETMLKLMAFVGVETTPGNGPLMLVTQDLVRNHVPDWEALLKLEAAVIEYNCSFFGNGKTLDFFANIAENFKGWIISTLTDLLAQSLASAKPPSTS